MESWRITGLNSLKISLIILIYLLIVGGFEVCDNKYCLSTDGLNKQINDLDSARQKCPNEWLLEIYDKSVTYLLSELISSKNANIDQQSNIILGMTEDNTGWIWSDKTKGLAGIEGQNATPTNAAVITKGEKSFKFIAKDIMVTGSFICSKDLPRDKCDGWFHEDSCYYKSVSIHRTWYKAHNECINNNSRLAIFKNITSVGSSSFIDNLEYWIALSRKTKMWKHSNSVVTYNQWLNGAIVHDNNCAVATSKGTDWIPSDCQGNFILVCMRDVENNQSSSDNPVITSPRTPDTKYPDLTALTTSASSAESSSLSIGGKVGLGVGIPLLTALIIVAVIFVTKYWKSSKPLPPMTSADRRNSSRKPIVDSPTYAEVVPPPIGGGIGDVNGQNELTYADIDHDFKLDSPGVEPSRVSESDNRDGAYATIADLDDLHRSE